MWTNKNGYRGNEVSSDISREMFYVTVVLCLNILILKAVSEITARQTSTSLRKHDVIKVCSIEYLTIQIELVLLTFFLLLDRSQNYRIFNVMTVVYPLKYLSHTTAYFFDPPCTFVHSYSHVVIDVSCCSVGVWLVSFLTKAFAVHHTGGITEYV